MYISHGSPMEPLSSEAVYPGIPREAKTAAEGPQTQCRNIWEEVDTTQSRLLPSFQEEGTSQGFNGAKVALTNIFISTFPTQGGSFSQCSGV